MEQPPEFVIPTVMKARISHLLSYPVGAERISKALAPVPQIKEMVLQFHAASGTGIRDVHFPSQEHASSSKGYEFLRVEYLHDSVPIVDLPIYSLWPRSKQYQWEIVVMPVFRADRHRINMYILESAFPAIVEWLRARHYRTERGSEILSYFYDIDHQEFISKVATKLEAPIG